MKITKQRLKEIIKEELQSTLQETQGWRRSVESRYTGSNREWRQALGAIIGMGYGLSDEQIENLAKNDRGTLDVYNRLINDPHTSLGELGEKIKATIGVPNWKAHQEYVKTFFDDASAPIKEEIASMEEAAEGEGCTVLPGTRVQHKHTKQKGYRCTGTKTGSGHGAKYWGIKWDDGSWDRDVPSDDVISLKDK